MTPGVIALVSALTELAIAGVEIAPILSGARQVLSNEDYESLEAGIKLAHARFDAAVKKRQEELDAKGN